MAWLFVPGLAGSNSGSTSPNPDTELWVSLSGKHEQRPLSWRESRWGNPFRWESPSTIAALERGEINRACIVESRADAVRMFRHCFLLFEANLAELRGKDLVCWCAPDQPCHADVLLEWANAPEGGAE